MRPATLSGDTLTDCFAAYVRSSPTATVTFPGTDERMTARELDEASLHSALGLMAHGVGPGSVVALLMPAHATFLSVFFGVQRAGAACSILPVSAGFGDEAGMTRRLARIIATAGIRHLVLDPGYGNVGKLLREQLPGLTVIDPHVTGLGSARTLPTTDPDALAVVQFTSGSTSAPKGVQLSQATMAAGLHASVRSGAFSPDDVFMQWVPVFHDMGLIGLCSHLLNGAEVHVFNPIAFLRRPATLLTYFAEHRGTVITGPNFSYDQILDTAPPELIAGLDLSHWRLAFNGAEPVSAATTERFTRLLAPAGVRDTVMYPAYGMAEATLAITFPEPGSPVRVLSVDREALAAEGRAVAVGTGAPGAKDVVSVGHPVHGIELRLMTEDGRQCGAGELGEIQIAGRPVTSGYYRDPQATAAAFDGRWFRTGDVGFQLDGHLYVTGRRKDMVVLRGQNYFPDDVEAIAREAPGVYRKRCVAFSDTEADGREIVRVVVEAVPAADGEDLVARIRSRVESEMDFSDVRVHLVKPRWLTRTSSGKWQRALTRERLAEQTGAREPMPDVPATRGREHR